jgi:hypothetical protein
MLLRAHHRHNLTHQLDRRSDVDRHAPLPIRVGDGINAPMVVHDPGNVEQNVDPAAIIGNAGLEDLCRRGRGGDVAGEK